MRRIRQSLPEILDKSSELPTVWKDELAERILNVLPQIPEERVVTSSDLQTLFEADFDAALHAFRLFIDSSKDEV